MTDTTRDLIQRMVDALTNAIRVIHNEDGTQHISTAAPVLAEALRAATDRSSDQAIVNNCQRVTDGADLALY